MFPRAIASTGWRVARRLGRDLFGGRDVLGSGQWKTQADLENLAHENRLDLTDRDGHRGRLLLETTIVSKNTLSSW